MLINAVIFFFLWTGQIWVTEMLTNRGSSKALSPRTVDDLFFAHALFFFDAQHPITFSLPFFFISVLLMLRTLSSSLFKQARTAPSPFHSHRSSFYAKMSTSSTPTCKLALVQLHVTADKDHNLANARSHVLEAASKGANLIVLPVRTPFTLTHSTRTNWTSVVECP